MQGPVDDHREGRLETRFVKAREHLPRVHGLQVCRGVPTVGKDDEDEDNSFCLRSYSSWGV